MASLLVDAAQLATFTTLVDIQKESGLKDEIWKKWSATLGDPPNIRFMAMIPAEVLQKSVTDLRIVTGAPVGDPPTAPTREPNVTETVGKS